MPQGADGTADSVVCADLPASVAEKNTLKAWAALLLPVSPRWRKKHEAERTALLKMEFKRFADSLLRVPCQIVRSGRRIIYRLLSWNPWTGVLLRLAEQMRLPLRC